MPVSASICAISSGGSTPPPCANAWPTISSNRPVSRRKPNGVPPPLVPGAARAWIATRPASAGHCRRAHSLHRHPYISSHGPPRRVAEVRQRAVRMPVTLGRPFRRSRGRGFSPPRTALGDRRDAHDLTVTGHSPVPARGYEGLPTAIVCPRSSAQPLSVSPLTVMAKMLVRGTSKRRWLAIPVQHELVDPRRTFHHLRNQLLPWSGVLAAVTDITSKFVDELLLRGSPSSAPLTETIRHTSCTVAWTAAWTTHVPRGSASFPMCF